MKCCSSAAAEWSRPAHKDADRWLEPNPRPVYIYLTCTRLQHNINQTHHVAKLGPLWFPYIEPDSSRDAIGQPDCAIVAGALNPGVTIMSVDNNGSAPPALLRGVELERQVNPDLRVNCDCWHDEYDYTPAQAARCRCEIAISSAFQNARLIFVEEISATLHTRGSMIVGHGRSFVLSR